MKTKYIFLITLFILSFNKFSAQVLIAKNTETNASTDPSAILEIRDSKTGVLFPQVPLLTNTDAVTVNSPLDGLLVYNTNDARYNFWQNNAWNKNFEIQDGLAIIKNTQNFSSNSTNSITINTFPSTMPLFALNSNTTGWTSLNTSTNINVTNASNTNYIIAEGMTQINNDNDTNQRYQYAIGVFVDGQLKIVRKYFKYSPSTTCIWNKFSLSGVFDNLSIGTHTVSVYAYNLPKSTSGYNSITYGGNASSCSNINNDMARVFLTAQITQ